MAKGAALSSRGGPDEESFRVNEREGIEKYSFTRRVLERIRRTGLHEPQSPVVTRDLSQVLDVPVGEAFDGRMPTSLRRLSLEQISDLYAAMNAHFAYVGWEAQKIEAERSEAFRQTELMEALVRRLLRVDPETGGPRSDQKRRDATKIDSRYVEYAARYEELDALHGCMQALLRVANRNMNIVSREITIRDAEIRHAERGRGIQQRANRAMYAERELDTSKRAFGIGEEEPAPEDEEPPDEALEQTEEPVEVSSEPPGKARGGDWRVRRP